MSDRYNELSGRTPNARHPERSEGSRHDARDSSLLSVAQNDRWPLINNRIRYSRYLHYLGVGSVLVFMFMLLVCALLFIFGEQVFAERLANWIYLFLVVGVGIRLVEFLKA